MTSVSRQKRAGGELEISVAQYVATAPRPLDITAKSPLGNGIWTDTGRSALLLAAMAILARGGRPRVWIPAFCCDSVTQPWIQAGFEIAYYESGPDLGGNGDSPLPNPQQGETLLFIHYFGHYNARMTKLASRLRAEGVWIVEDCVQGSLMPAPGAHGDFAVTSYRKVLPVVDGAALFCREPVPPAAPGLHLESPDESFISARMIGKLLRGGDGDAADFLPLVEFSEGLLQGHIVPRRLSWLSSWMLERLDWNEAVSRRRANWTRLARNIGDGRANTFARPMFSRLGDDDVPLGLPILVSGEMRDQLRRFLAESEVYCAVHWRLDHLPASADFEFERDLASASLTLPIDQSMSFAQVDHVAERLASFFNQA